MSKIKNCKFDCKSFKKRAYSFNYKILILFAQFVYCSKSTLNKSQQSCMLRRLKMNDK